MGVKKNFYTVFGWIIISISILTIGISLNNFLSPVDVKSPYDVQQFAVTNCQNNLRSLQLSNTQGRDKRVIEVSTVGLENWAYDLGNYSLAIKSCKGFKITSFCQGKSCVGKDNGTFLKLFYQKKI